MQIEHNSQLDFYRSPFGAVETGKEVKLRLVIKDGGIPHSIKCMCKTENETWENHMMYEFTAMDSSVYNCTLNMPESPCLLWYWFEIKTDEGLVYYGNNERGLGGLGEQNPEPPALKYQITVYDKSYRAPEWFKEKVAYQIFPDRFFNGNPDGSFLGDRDDILKRRWGDEPYCTAEEFGGKFLCNDFFGGNLKGIKEKLPYLKDLGIGVIYLNPIFEAFSNHRYDTGDYEKIDSVLGTEEDFADLCKEAEKLGIGIILDGVFNHTGSNSKYFNKDGKYDTIGAYQGESSPYYDWYRFGKTRDEYECWWGMDTLPHTEESSKSYQSYIEMILKKWLKLGAKGWRLDVVDELPGFFVKMIRRAVKSVGADNVVIGEVWEDASNKVSYSEQREYFLGYELDSVMNYPLRCAIIDGVLGNKDAKGVAEVIMSLKENYPKESFYSCLNMLSSHDSERLLMAVSGIDKPQDRKSQASVRLYGSAKELAEKRALCAMSLQMFLPGVPCIYYGDEIGMEGFADPSCRRTFDWSRVENNSYLEKIQELIKTRNSEPVFSTGELEFIYTLGNLLAFARYTDKEKYIVVANLSDKHERIRLDAGRLNVYELADEYGNIYNSNDGIYYLDIDGYEVKYYKSKW